MTPSKRDIERRLDKLEGDEGEDMSIQEAMWEALTDYYDR